MRNFITLINQEKSLGFNEINKQFSVNENDKKSKKPPFDFFI